MAKDDKPEGAEDDKPEAEEGKNIIGSKYRDAYGKDGHNGDDIAKALKAYLVDDKNKIDLEKMAEVAEANGVDMTKYANLNIGLQRMNLGNRLRGINGKGNDVVIGTDTFKPKAKAEEESKAA